MSQLTKEELQLLQVLQDPVTWAKVFLDWEARWYQEKIIRDKSTRIVVRAGRRTGKSDSLCVRMLYSAYTKPGRKIDESYVVLVVTPYEAQIQLIFKRLRELINKCPMLKQSVVRDVQSPSQEITFANGGRISGFTAGTKTGAGAANLRGQRADLMILDECDYFNEADIKTVMAIPLEDPGRIVVIATSTPSGQRSYFYRWCQPNSNWSHHHYPGNVSPTWSKEVEEEFRRELSELAYLQEIEAEFGEEAAGIFQKQYIDFAVAKGRELKLTYPDKAPERRGPRVLGVDWDKYSASPTLVGLEWDEELKLFIPIYRKEIPRTQFSLDAAVQEIINSDLEYNWDFIYVDRGYGEHQVETLRKYGITNPTTNMHRKVMGVHFGDKVDVPDPHTKQREKKHFKPFAVNNLAIIFERYQIALVPTDKRIIEQLEGYRIESIGPSGQPTFTSVNEHFVDALMLAVYGHTIQFSDITKVRMASRVVSIPVMESKSGVESREIKEEPKKTNFTSMLGISVGLSPRSSGRATMGAPKRSKF